jgi:hypothetical protein
VGERHTIFFFFVSCLNFFVLFALFNRGVGERHMIFFFFVSCLMFFVLFALFT